MVAGEHVRAEGDAEGSEQLVERWEVGAARDRLHPGVGVLVEEADRAEDGRMVPLSQHDEGEAAPRHVVAQLDLLTPTIRARVRAWGRARGQW